MQRQEPACSQLSRKLKQSFSFAADYFNVKWVSAVRGGLKMYVGCFTYKFSCSKLARLQLKKSKAGIMHEDLLMLKMPILLRLFPGSDAAI